MSGFLFGLLVISWAVGIYHLRRRKERIDELEKAFEKIRIEETRMFDFLHELGAAFYGELRPEKLHRLIVEAAMDILNAHGGALYVLDRRSEAIRPSFISKSCPPLLEVPAHILAQAEQNPVALHSYLRRHPVEPGEGVIGTVWTTQEAVLLAAQNPSLRAMRDTVERTESVMVAPLVYGTHRIGVLALANGGMSRDFDKSDFALFKAIAEQSAFALYSATIYSEANEKRQLDLDLNIAQEVQHILLPNAAPRVPGYEIHGINIPASRVSGDYYDYIPVDNDHTGIVIADVSGKGIPASLVMAMCRSVLRGAVPGHHSAAETLRRVNRQLHPDIKEDMFVSMAYLILDHHTSEATLCRAGHDAPLHYSAATETVARINPPGMAVGIDSGAFFDTIARDYTVKLESGDCLILYTDGVTEALDGNGQEFGINKMIQSIQASAADGPAAILARLTDDLRTFIGSFPQNDDITLIVIRKT